MKEREVNGGQAGSCKFWGIIFVLGKFPRLARRILSQRVWGDGGFSRVAHAIGARALRKRAIHPFVRVESR